MDRSGPFVHAEVARKLERERDEAREALEFRRELYKVQEQCLETARRERDEAREKIKRQAERICQLEGATNHAGGTPLSIALRERDEAKAERDILRLDAQREAEQHDRMVGELEKVYAERDEARQRASDLALGVKVADCMYDYGKYSVALREAKIKARYLQELTRAAYDEVEKLEDQEATL